MNGSFSPARDANLPLHEVDAGHELGDRMLDLEARVHLEEVELAVAVEQELARAGVHVAGGLRGAHRRLAHRAPQLRRHGDARRLLDHLLVAALHRALALAERQHRAVLVAEHLDLDVARADDVLLDVHRVVAEGVLRLAPRGVERRRESRSRSRTTRMPFPPPPAAALSSTG